MKMRALLIMVGSGLGSFASEPVLPQFSPAPLNLVPAPLTGSLPSELLALQRSVPAYISASRELSSPLPSVLLRAPTPYGTRTRMPVVEPNPHLRYTMPIVTPDADVDYKLRIMEAEPPPETESTK